MPQAQVIYNCHVKLSWQAHYRRGGHDCLGYKGVRAELRQGFVAEKGIELLRIISGLPGAVTHNGHQHQRGQFDTGFERNGQHQSPAVLCNIGLFCAEINRKDSDKQGRHNNDEVAVRLLRQ